MVGCPRPNRWLVEPDSTARFTQRALVRMKEKRKALLSKNKNELSGVRALYVSLDRADNVIEGGPSFVNQRVGVALQRGSGGGSLTPSALVWKAWGVFVPERPKIFP